MIATPPPHFHETVSETIPDLTPSSEGPVIIAPSVPGMSATRLANVWRLSQVERNPAKWLWPQGTGLLPPEPGLLPHQRWSRQLSAGKVMVIAGENGLGKSSLAADLAARVSRGSPWPGDDATTSAPQGTALFVGAAEQQFGLLPARLEGAGADLDRVCTIEMELMDDPTIGNRPMRPIVERLALVQSALEKLPDCKLVVIDPLSVFLDGPDGRHGRAVQYVFQGLAKLARRFGVAVVVVAHLNGTATLRSFSQLMATVGPPSIARSVWGVLRDPEAADKQLMVSLDGNFAKESETMSFRLANGNAPAGSDHPHPGPLPKGEGEGELKLPHVEWGTAAPTSLCQALRASSGFRVSEQKYRDMESYVVTRLREVLAGGPVLREEITREIQASQEQIYRGADALGVVKQKEGFWKGWIWMLPEHYPQWQADQDRSRQDNDVERERRKNAKRKLKREMQKAEFKRQKAEGRRQNDLGAGGSGLAREHSPVQAEQEVDAASRAASESPSELPLPVPLGSRDVPGSPESVPEKKDLPPLTEEAKEYNRKFHEQVRLEREGWEAINETARRWLTPAAPSEKGLEEEVSAEEEARLCWVDDDGKEIEESGAGVRDGPG